MRELRNCSDCGVKPGELHQYGCDIERCPLCGGQSIGCHCVYEVNNTNVDDYGDDSPTDAMYNVFDAEVEKTGGRLPWTGLYPGVAECAEYGWYSKWSEAKGWERCDKDDPEGSEDLNRLGAWSCTWSRELRRFVRPS